MNGSEMFRQMTNDKQTSKHKLGNRTNRWSKVQADARCPNSKKQMFSADFISGSRDFTQH